MLAIKLQRVGKKHQPSFRLVVGEKRSKVGGRQVEYLGWYDPLRKQGELQQERIRYWLQRGAQPTLTVRRLLLAKKIIAGANLPTS